MNAPAGNCASPASSRKASTGISWTKRPTASWIASPRTRSSFSPAPGTAADPFLRRRPSCGAAPRSPFCRRGLRAKAALALLAKPRFMEGSPMNVSAPVSVRSNSFFSAPLADADPEIARAIELELGRQRDSIELIASENIVSRAVLEAQGSVMTNKYAEGYPGRRYYGGCQFVDIAENLAIERACRLFDCKFANVQPNSGSQANQGVFMALMQPGDTFMGLDLAAGGPRPPRAPPRRTARSSSAGRRLAAPGDGGSGEVESVKERNLGNVKVV